MDLPSSPPPHPSVSREPRERESRWGRYLLYMIGVLGAALFAPLLVPRRLGFQRHTYLIIGVMVIAGSYVLYRCIRHELWMRRYEGAEDLKRQQHLRMPTDPVEEEIRLQEYGFSIRRRMDRLHQSGMLPWSAIAEVYAYRQQDLAGDRVALLLRYHAEVQVTVHEHMEGFTAFCQALSHHLPGFPRDQQWATVLHRSTQATRDPVKLYPLDPAGTGT